MAKHAWTKKSGYAGYVCEKCGKRERRAGAETRRRPGGAVGMKRSGCPAKG